MKMGRILQIAKKWDNCSHHDPTHEANVDLSLEIMILSDVFIIFGSNIKAHCFFCGTSVGC
jgi:hypothetical protein